MKTALTIWCAQQEVSNRPAINSLTAEIVGWRFMRALGVGTAPAVELVRQPEARRDKNTADWYFKFGHPDGRVLAIQRIPHAISLTCLRIIHGIASETAQWNYPGGAEFAAIAIRNIMHLGNSGQVPDPAVFYADFSLPASPEKIMSAIRWNSPQMTEIHAARLLLGCSLAHAGNVCVDERGGLYSIDHANISFTENDAEVLSENLPRGSQVRSVVAHVVSRLKPTDIAPLFHNLPDLPWPLGTRAATVRYFQQRLRSFQERFK